MLNALTLTNFMQHEELAISFTGGLNVLRGANEAGKSSIFNAVAYAFYGARALPMSLEDTVTWTKPVSTLKVELSFTHTGLTYSLTRRKSGAELLGPDGLRVSGQSEVTGYIERLFACGIGVAVATMIASQSDLKQSLDGSAVSLIEKLSNMALIDQLVDKVQTNLPSGNTKLFETQLASLVDMVEPVEDCYALVENLCTAETTAYAADDAEEQAHSEYELAKAEADAAAARMVEADKIDLRRRMLNQQIAKHLTDQCRLAPVCDEPLTFEELTAAKERQDFDVTVRARWELFQNLPMSLSHDRAKADAECDVTEALLKTAKAELRTAELTKATVRAGIITQSACGLCGKDLANVPEVVEVNNKAFAKIAELDTAILVCNGLIKLHDSTLNKWLHILSIDRKQDVQLGQLVGYVSVDNSFIPKMVKWSGPVVSAAVDTENYAPRLAAIRRHQHEMTSHTALKEQARTSARTLQAELAALPVIEANPLDALAADAVKVKLADARAAVVALNAAKQAVSTAKHALDTARQAHAFAVERYAAGLAKRDDLAATITTYNTNNSLVKRLREARPIVAKNLWNSVLAAVSTYFSTIRGTPSVVTRDDDGFLIDGKSVKAYSGSTKDALGLAIRITLQKTFLGALDTMLVDEPASAADPARESAMLGMLATCGYAQVVLVTHSDLADSFAANIIRI